MGRGSGTKLSDGARGGPPPEIVSTKLCIPRVRSYVVHRHRLRAQLKIGMNSALTLICAPPGFGKTTLLVDWLGSQESEAGSRLAVAWVTLDADDNDPVQFIRLLATALRTAIPDLAGTVLAMLEDPQPTPPRTAFTVLINDLVASQREIMLVFEDYHVIREPRIHEAVTFLLDHLPPLLHVVIATREDPPLPLARLRARGALCELREADLRFTVDEAAMYLPSLVEFPITPDEVAALTARTEGWAAGLQLAALSIRAGHVVDSLAEFGGSHRTVLDFFGTEVLARQPDPVRTFLLRTSPLDRLTAPLCDAVLGDVRPEGGAQAMLEQIERSNLFLTEMDGRRQWYRYHQLSGLAKRGVRLC